MLIDSLEVNQRLITPVVKATSFFSCSLKQSREHVRECERHKRRDGNRPGNYNTEFTEKPSGHSFKENNREKYSHQRDGGCHNGKKYFVSAFYASFHRGHSLFNFHVNIFHHHNGIVHHKTD